MVNLLLLDKKPVRLLIGDTLVTGYPVNRRDWALLPVGATIAWLDTGEEMGYGPRIIWSGKVLSNQLFKARGRGSFTFAPDEPSPNDDPTFEVEAEGIRQLYLLAPPTGESRRAVARLLKLHNEMAART